MNTIYLLRHARAVDASPTVAELDRYLPPEGIRRLAWPGW